jgi:PAS domain S-box-containing protein
LADSTQAKMQLIEELKQMSAAITQSGTVNAELKNTVELCEKVAARLSNEISGKDVDHEMRRRYEFIVNNAREFMTLINRDYIYEAANDSYCLAHDKKRADILGKSVKEVWGSKVFQSTIKKHLDTCLSGKEVKYEAWFSFSAIGRRYFDVRYYPYYNQKGSVTHVVVVTHDITQRKMAEDELNKHRNHLEEMVRDRTFDLEKSNQQLQTEILERKQLEEKQQKLIEDLKIALNNVKRLEGLLPICAKCKKVRDDKGYWEEVDAYLVEHSHVEFTHGICPECAKLLYPEFYNDKKDE